MAYSLSAMLNDLQESMDNLAIARVAGLTMGGMSKEKAKEEVIANARAAANQGDTGEQNFLGGLYYFGSFLGIDKNQKEGLDWWDKSAKLGDKNAKEVLQAIRGY